MGQPYGGPNPEARDSRVRGNDPYVQTPAPSQLYPPLGYAPDGTALFRPGQPTNTELRIAEQASRDEARVAAESTRESDDESRLATVSTSSLIVCLGLVVLVAVAIVGFSGMFRNQPTEPPLADPPTTIDTVPLPRTFEPPRLTPDDPGRSAPGGPDQRVNPQDKPVTYEVTIDGQATILYVDSMGLRSEFAPSNPWSVEFTGGDNPLRLLVIAGTGSGAKCSITVDGKVVVEDAVTATSARRTASCIA
ncbi:hypothetical protein FOV72_16295 [Gordonia rubripertincta]|uniref:hypothetical protein n=1 Tax=Gordonia rubripertincta TaxID=36822 RepID=UPI00117E9988|nr:hypothetical protein [Gordonia rubripertincta]TSD94765.1 hypothetical protein FOV72_16295 [Gordonia rubripertincta]